MKRKRDFIGPAKAVRQATHTLPGSAERLTVMAERAARGQDLFTDDDQPEAEAGLVVDPGRNGKPIVVGIDRQIAEKQIRFTAVKLTLFSERLLFLRRRRGLLMIQVARRAGIRPHTLYYLEVGESQPSFRTAIALAQALAVPVSILAGESLE